MDIFDHAMQMEREGEEYYRELASRTANSGLKNILNMLADDEAKHFKVFEEMKEGLTTGILATKVLSDAKNIFSEMKRSIATFDFSGSEKSLYKKALEIEKKSEEFYREKSDEAELADQKKVLLRIAEEEKKHYLLVENIIDFVSKPDTYLENAEFFHLDEY